MYNATYLSRHDALIQIGYYVIEKNENLHNDDVSDWINESKLKGRCINLKRMVYFKNEEDMLLFKKTFRTDCYSVEIDNFYYWSSITIDIINNYDKLINCLTENFNGKFRVRKLHTNKFRIFFKNEEDITFFMLKFDQSSEQK